MPGEGLDRPHAAQKEIDVEQHEAGDSKGVHLALDEGVAGGRPVRAPVVRAHPGELGADLGLREALVATQAAGAGGVEVQPLEGFEDGRAQKGLHCWGAVNKAGPVVRSEGSFNRSSINAEGGEIEKTRGHAGRGEGVGGTGGAQADGGGEGGGGGGKDGPARWDVRGRLGRRGARGRHVHKAGQRGGDIGGVCDGDAGPPRNHVRGGPRGAAHRAAPPEVRRVVRALHKRAERGGAAERELGPQPVVRPRARGLPDVARGAEGGGAAGALREQLLQDVQEAV